MNVRHKKSRPLILQVDSAVLANAAWRGLQELLHELESQTPDPVVVEEAQMFIDLFRIIARGTPEVSLRVTRKSIVQSKTAEAES